MIAVFGGAFNPPTIAHYEVAKHILHLPLVESLFFMPVGDHYEKAELIPAFHRMKMLEAMITNDPNMSVSKIEIEAHRKLRTLETLEKLQIEFPEKMFAFVMGADNLSDLTGWYNYKTLINRFKIIIINRGELDVNQLIKEHFEFAVDNFLIVDNFLKMDISSSQYRQDTTQSDLVHLEVESYIKKHRLYQNNHD